MATNCVIDTNRLQSFFNKLETRKTLLMIVIELFQSITNHFTSLEQSLALKSQTLDSKIEVLDTETKKALESLKNRKNTIPERESAAAARIKEKRESAIFDIEKSETGGVRILLDVLTMYCRKMDSAGLLCFLSKRADWDSFRAEIAAALEESVDSMSLVLDAVEHFVEMKRKGKARRWWLYWVLIREVLPVRELCVARSVRERAAGMLEKWKGVLVRAEWSQVAAGEAAMFLQMVVGFGLKKKFEEEFLTKMVVEFAARRDMAKLAVALGFVDKKMGDIIDVLVKSGKEIEAVYFASESGLTDQFPPVPLLNTYLKNCKINADNISKNGNYSVAAVEEANNSELNASRAIIKCVKDNKLQSQYPSYSLHKRVTQLETNAEKKKSSGSTSNPSNKRAHGGSGRGSDPPAFQPPKVARFCNSSPSFCHRNPSQWHQAPAASFSALYNYPNQGMYEGPGKASYEPGYGRAHPPFIPALM